MKPAAVALLVLAGAALASKLVNVAADAQALAGEDATGSTALDSIDVWGEIGAMSEGYQVQNAMQSDNLGAFLSLIAYSEGTDRKPDPYRVCYGYKHTIQNLSDHPAVTGEWRGESIASLGPAYAGKVSTAAGRYQIIKPTWLEVKRSLRLADFGPASQDAAACLLIKRRGALADIQEGRIVEAIAKCRAEWASLPGAGYGQPERKTSDLLAAYERAGGWLA